MWLHSKIWSYARSTDNKTFHESKKKNYLGSLLKYIFCL